MRPAAIVAVGLLLTAANLIGWSAVIAAADREGERIHADHHVTGERPCGCAVGVEEARAEVQAVADMVAQRLDLIESRCVWLGPHRVPVMKVGRAKQ